MTINVSGHAEVDQMQYLSLITAVCSV